ncbi:hypothetical protein [Actinomyces sp. HMT897]|uniref:hypothetical protein n=1 Tax=Actinomyces sp. HMT897 TaxID=2789424 RepID=UPI00190BF1DB|nr:hypothetical protein [Actinomyces sp. HMT897]QQO78152.1 hypothetical protein JJJ15_01950 [Actinomyces sp. HMT897]DAR87814.1 MAG TPA: hypothetical protein [Caudoviricetes sp.]
MATTDRTIMELTDLAQWAPLLTDVGTAVLDPHTPRGRTHTTPTHFPFHLDQTWDHDEDGATGVRTQAGLEDLLTSIARPVATLLDETITPTVYAYLATRCEWMAEHDGDWDTTQDTIHQAWATLAHLTGHTPQNLGSCPVPGCPGTIQAATGRQGRSDHAFCDTCDTYLPTDYTSLDKDYLLRILRPTMRTATVPSDAVVEMTELATIWAPDVPRNTLEVWAKRGVLTKYHDRRRTVYRLRDANTAIIARLPLHRRPPHRVP